MFAAFGLEPAGMVARIKPARWAAAIAVLAASAPANAGPPFLTDDPAPTAKGTWEVFSFASGLGEYGATTTSFGLDLNYAPSDVLQAGVVVPLLAQPGMPVTPGDVELGAKLQLLRQDRGALLTVSTVPRLYLPTGPDMQRTRLFLPLWAQRDFGPWSVYGGAGWTLDPGVGRRNFWQGGVAVTRRLRPGWSGGAELYALGSPTPGTRPLTLVSLGTAVHLSGPVSLLGSFGQGVNRPASVFYAALKLDL